MSGSDEGKAKSKGTNVRARQFPLL
eukprot:COSAG01_NODE_49464_length_370_cov_0.567766_2_plen_24_part_01